MPNPGRSHGQRGRVQIASSTRAAQVGSSSPAAGLRGSPGVIAGPDNSTISSSHVVPTAAVTTGLPNTSPDVTTIGVKRTAFGQTGRALTVLTNHFEVQIPNREIYHYDGALHPAQLVLFCRLITPYIYLMLPSRSVFLVLPTLIFSLTRAPS